jgi:cytidylate kinase
MRQYKKRFGVHEVTIDQIYKQIQKRDDLDMNRKIAPLVPYKESKIINNTAIKRVDTVKRILTLFHKRYPEVPVD